MIIQCCKSGDLKTGNLAIFECGGKNEAILVDLKYSEFSKIVYKSKSTEAKKDVDTASKDEMNGCGYKNTFGLHDFTVSTNNVGDRIL